jgi:hypothetical protein
MKKLVYEDIIKTKITDFSPADAFSDLYIDPLKKIEHQPIAISAGYKFNEYIPIVTYGNFSCIVGASKSMKSFFKSALLACYIGGNATNHFSEIKGHGNKDKFILDLDTEQSEYHCQKASHRVLKMIGGNYEYYKMFALRSLNPNERVQFLEYLFLESEYKNKIGLCSIDGVADLIENVNDLDKSNMITQKLMKISADHNTALLTILHRNFESEKPTGHLGSAILKKAESTIFVDKNEDIVTVKPKYTRNIPFDGFTFGLDENQLPSQLDSIF